MQMRISLSWVHLEQEMLGLEEVWEKRGAGFWKENRDKPWGMKEPKTRVCSPEDQSWSRIKGIKHQTQYWWWLKIIGNLFNSHLGSEVWQFLLKLYRLTRATLLDLLDFATLSMGLPWAFPQSCSPESLYPSSRGGIPGDGLRPCQAVSLHFWQWMHLWSWGIIAGKEGKGN